MSVATPTRDHAASCRSKLDTCVHCSQRIIWHRTDLRWTHWNHVSDWHRCKTTHLRAARALRSTGAAPLRGSGEA